MWYLTDEILRYTYLSIKITSLCMLGEIWFRPIYNPTAFNNRAGNDSVAIFRQGMLNA